MVNCSQQDAAATADDGDDDDNADADVTSQQNATHSSSLNSLLVTITACMC